MNGFKYWNRQYKYDMLKSMFIVLVPFSIYIHLLFDQTNNGIIEIFGEVYRHGYIDASAYVWMILIRIIPISLFLVWFLTSAYWWRYFIFVPLSVNFYALFEESFDSPFFLHDDRPVYILLIVSLFLIATFIFDLKFQKSRSSQSIIINSNGKIPSKELFEKLIYNFTRLEKLKYQSKDMEYLSRLVFLKGVIKDRIVAEITMKVGGMKYFRKNELLIILILLSIPAFVYMHKMIPKDLMELNLYWFTLDSNGFSSLRMYIWFLNSKFAVLICLIVWFHTSTNWWRYAILSPVILYSYQFWEGIQSVNELDASGNLTAFPAIFAIILLLIILSKIFKYNYRILDLYDSVSYELDNYINVMVKEQISDYLKSSQNIYASKLYKKVTREYIKDLISLQSKLKIRLRINS